MVNSTCYNNKSTQHQFQKHGWREGKKSFAAAMLPV
jgi:hypothetical protein